MLIDFIEGAKRIAAKMLEQFGVPLVLIEVDTLVATAGYKKTGDANDDVRSGLGILNRALSGISA